MKVLHVIHSLDPRSGGPSNYLSTLVRAQLRAGLEVSVIATDVQSGPDWIPRDKYIASLRGGGLPAGEKLHIVRGFGKTGALRRLRFSPEAGTKLRGLFNSPMEAPDLVHIHGLFSHLTIVASRIAKRFRIPYILRPAGGLNPMCFAAGAVHGKALLWQAFVKSDFAHAAAIHATSEREAAVISRVGFSEKSFVSGLGIELKQRTKLNCVPSTILFLSRLHPKKRPEFCLESLQLLSGEFSDVRLIFAGPDGGAEGSLRRRATDLGLGERIEFRGPVAAVERDRLFSSSSVLALPSIDENFGLVVIEALGAGLPAVVTRGVDAGIHVEKSGCGRVTGDSVGEFAEGLATILRNGRESLADSGASYAQEHLSIDAVEAGLSAVYKRILCSKE